MMPLMHLFYAVSGNACVLISFHRFASIILDSRRASGVGRIHIFKNSRRATNSNVFAWIFASIVGPHRRVLVRRHSTVRLTFLLWFLSSLATLPLSVHSRHARCWTSAAFSVCATSTNDHDQPLTVWDDTGGTDQPLTGGRASWDHPGRTGPASDGGGTTLGEQNQPLTVWDDTGGTDQPLTVWDDTGGTDQPLTGVELRGITPGRRDQPLTEEGPPWVNRTSL